MSYNQPMIVVATTEEYDDWFEGLKDARARRRILARLDRIKSGLFGDAKPVGEGVSELRIDYGPGYRVYYLRRGGVLVILLAGGDKSTQRRDISRAIAMAREIKEDIQ